MLRRAKVNYSRNRYVAADVENPLNDAIRRAEAALRAARSEREAREEEARARIQRIRYRRVAAWGE